MNVLLYCIHKLRVLKRGFPQRAYLNLRRAYFHLVLFLFQDCDSTFLFQQSVTIFAGVLYTEKCELQQKVATKSLTMHEYA